MKIDIAKLNTWFKGKWVMVFNPNSETPNLLSYECLDIRPWKDGIEVLLKDRIELHIRPQRVTVNAIEAERVKIQIGWNIPATYALIDHTKPLSSNERWSALEAYMISLIPKSCRAFADEEQLTSGPDSVNDPPLLGIYLIDWIKNLQTLNYSCVFDFEPPMLELYKFKNFTHLLNSMYVFSRAWKGLIHFEITPHTSRGRMTHVVVVWKVVGFETKQQSAAA